MGCYRTGEANDPEIYVRAIASVLGEYPEQIVRTVCSPRTGIPGKAKWLPNPAEVKSACEEAMRPILRLLEEERLAEECRNSLTGPTRLRMTAEEMEARYGKNYGLSGGKERVGRTDGVRPLAEILREIGLTEAEYEVIYASQTKLERNK